MREKKNKWFSLKDQLFNRERVTWLAHQIVWVFQDFDGRHFIEECVSQFPELELKQRVAHISSLLKKFLPEEYSDALTILVRSLPQELDPTQSDDDFWDFILEPINHFIAEYWCSEEYFDISWNALKETTKRFSAEFAVREFINVFPKRMLKEFSVLAKSSNYHQRRLVSEWSRLTLPWAKNIVWRAEEVFPLLDLLYADTTRYVTRSVANNLNSISKVDPEWVLEKLMMREKEWKQTEKEMWFIKKHSLRTLLKQWNQQALRVFWFTQPDHIEVWSLDIPKKVSEWESVLFGIMIQSTDRSALWKCRVEYALWYMKANGERNEKVFKMAEFNSNESMVSYEKKHSFKVMTTRKQYAGTHTFTLIVNGKRYETVEFQLSKK